MDTTLTMQPRTSAGSSAKTPEDRVLELVAQFKLDVP